MNNTKENLKTLIQLPIHQYNAIIKLINPKLTNEDLQPMFPEGWDDNNKWPLESKESNAERWEKWQPHQIRIDAELERQMGC